MQKRRDDNGKASVAVGGSRPIFLSRKRKRGKIHRIRERGGQGLPWGMYCSEGKSGKKRGEVGSEWYLVSLGPIPVGDLGVKFLWNHKRTDNLTYKEEGGDLDWGGNYSVWIPRGTQISG